MCVLAESVAKSDIGVTKAIANLPFNVTDNTNLTFKLKMQQKYVGFCLLDTFMIKKRLFVPSFGAIISYGIIIATFNSNSASNDII